MDEYKNEIIENTVSILRELPLAEVLHINLMCTKTLELQKECPGAIWDPVLNGGT